MTKTAFVIPCKYSKDVPILFNCLQSIRKYHPNDDIFVVDSASEDKSYFERAETEFNATVLDVTNKNYLTGAIWHVYNNHKRDFYYCIHDSIELLESLESLQDKKLSPLMYHKHWQWPKDPVTGKRSYKWSQGQVKNRTKLNFEKVKKGSFYILQGAILCCSSQVLKELKEHKY